jgi:ribosomal protein S18 acetylase RimI-like enzyme
VRAPGGHDVKLVVREAVAADANEIAALRVAAADDLTARFGKGFWSSNTTDKGVLFGMKQGKVLIATSAGVIVGTLTLSTRKPWAIDPAYFTKVKHPVYLTSMAVDPKLQKRGIGRFMLDAASRSVRARPGDAIRLDAFDDAAGAGEFYAKNGYVEKGRVTFRQVPLIYYELLLGP